MSDGGRVLTSLLSGRDNRLNCQGKNSSLTRVSSLYHRLFSIRKCLRMSTSLYYRREKVILSMGPTMAALFSVVLEYALMEMKIVEGCSKLRKTTFPRNLSSNLDAVVAVREERAKLEADRKLVFQVLLGTILDITERGEWKQLTVATQDLTRDSIALETVRIDHDYLKKSLELLSKELKANKRENKRALNKAEDKITELKDQTQDEKLNANMRLRYAEKWISAKEELVEFQDNTPRNPVPAQEHEQRVHEEILRIYDLQTQEKQKAIEYWRIKYAADTCDIIRRVSERREELQIITTRRQQLENKYNSRASEINAWLTVKRLRAEKKATEERHRRAATLIEAWWRGEMVRHALGVFKHLRTNSKKPIQTKIKKK